MVLLTPSIPVGVRADVRFNEDTLTARDGFSTRGHGSFVISLPVSVIVSEASQLASVMQMNVTVL